MHERGDQAARRVLEVFEIFENEPASLRFIAGIFPTVARTLTLTLTLTPNPKPNPNPNPKPNPNPNP